MPNWLTLRRMGREHTRMEEAAANQRLLIGVGRDSNRDSSSQVDVGCSGADYRVGTSTFSAVRCRAVVVVIVAEADAEGVTLMIYRLC